MNDDDDVVRKGNPVLYYMLTSHWGVLKVSQLLNNLEAGIVILFERSYCILTQKDSHINDKKLEILAGICLLFFWVVNM